MTEFGAGKKRNDIGFLNFDLQADLEPLFNWNVKQLFLYLTAEYETDTNVTMQPLFIKEFMYVKLKLAFGV
jgi:signal peptidase complex subunit 3